MDWKATDDDKTNLTRHFPLSNDSIDDHSQPWVIATNNRIDTSIKVRNRLGRERIIPNHLLDLLYGRGWRLDWYQADVRSIEAKIVGVYG
jgi:hypothetical protein